MLHFLETAARVRDTGTLAAYFQPVASANVSRRAVFNLACTDDLVAVALEDSGVSLLDPRSYRQISRLQGHSDCVNVAKFMRSDGRLLATGSDDATVCIWDLRLSKRPLMQLSGHNG